MSLSKNNTTINEKTSYNSKETKFSDFYRFPGSITKKTPCYKTSLDSAIKNQEKTPHICSLDVENDSSRSNKSLPSFESLGSYSSSGSRASKKWRCVSILFKSLRILQHNEAIRLESADHLSQIMENEERPKPPSLKTQKSCDGFGTAFEHFLDVEKISECAERGGEKDLFIMKQIIENDEKRYLMSPSDPDHLLNKKNRNGETPLYVASRGGNLSVVKYLVESNANVYLSVKMADKIQELPIHVASRWSHQDIVSYLLNKAEYTDIIVKECISSSSTPGVQSTLKRKLRLIEGKKDVKPNNIFSNFLRVFCC